MAQAVIMPKFGQTVEESSIVKWHKKEGDVVKKGDILFEIETDKSVLEVESFFEGTLIKVVIAENITVPVNTVVAYVGDKGEKAPDAPPPAAAAPKAEAPAPTAAAPAAQPKADAPASAPAIQMPKPAVPAAAVQPGRLFISPRAKVLVKNSAVNAANIKGSGPGGRIVEADVKAYLESRGYANLKITPTAKQMAQAEGIDVLTVKGTGDGGRIRTEDIKRAIAEKPKKMSKMRQIIAKRLTESFMMIPHFYVTVSVDMTDLMVFRQELKDAGKKYTVTDFILEAVVMTLQEFPMVNSTTDGLSVSWRGSVHLGLAVSLDEGLVVPCIRDAQDLSLQELRDTAKAMAAKAREGKLLPDEMTGSTFTVSNMGMMDVDEFHAIINPGEGAILAVASTRETAGVRDGKVCVRNMMKITLSCDHRIVDGALGATFVNAIRKKLENVEIWKSLA